MAEPVKMSCGLRTWVGPGNHVLDGVQIPHGTILSGKGASHCKPGTLCSYLCKKRLNRSRCRLSCGPKETLDGGPEVLGDIAMTTSFGTQFAKTGFV